MKPLLLLIACIVGATSGATYFSTFNSGNQIIAGGHQINLITEPTPKLYVDGQLVNLTTAGSRQNGSDFVLYTDFPNLPGLSLKLFNSNGGYTLYYENNGVVSRFGTLSPEEQEQLNRQMQVTFDNVNRQIAQVQQQVGNMMQALTNMFSQPGWPFTG